MAKAALFMLGMGLTSTHSAIILARNNLQLQSPSNSSFTELQSEIGDDPRLRVAVKYYDDRISSRSCFMNAVEALAVLALKDYSGVIPNTKFSAPGYTDVEIEIKPDHAGQSIEVKYAVLGIYYALVTMACNFADLVTVNTFKAAAFRIYWDESIVAWIWIQAPGLSNGTSTQNLTGLLAETSLNLNNTSPILYTEPFNESYVTNTTDTTNTQNADVELVMSFYPYGTPLTEAAVFVAVLATLKDVAQFPSTDIVDPFEIGTGVSDCVIQWDEASSAGLAGPPSYEYRWIVEAAKQIPVWMMSRKFWETFFTIEVNGYVVGQGAVRRVEPPADRLESNLTTS